MPAVAQKSGDWVSSPDFLRTMQFLFVPNIDVIDNINLGVVTKKQGDDSTWSLATLATKSVREQSISPMAFDMFSSYQKLLRVTAYMRRLLPAHKKYRTVDGSISVELDEADGHLQHFIQG